MNLTTVTVLAFWSGLFKYLSITLFILICLLLMGIILLQKGRGGGLSSAFGGAMGSSPFGTKTGDVFTWITVVLAGLYLFFAIILNLVYVQEGFDTKPQAAKAPAAAGSDAADQNADKTEGATENATDGGAGEHTDAAPTGGTQTPSAAPAGGSGGTETPATPAGGGN
ncbi:MAG: hypothetical protein BIFFINMI_00719 [Phycisphaerae bacterium]|nr:hypothetical protein [Phycisphaerae bacterium]